MPRKPVPAIAAAIDRASGWWVDASLASFPGPPFNAAQYRRLVKATSDAMAAGASIGVDAAGSAASTEVKKDTIFDGLWRGTWTTLAKDIERKHPKLLDAATLEQIEATVESMTTSLLELSMFDQRGGGDDDEIIALMILLRGAVLAGLCMEAVRRTPVSELTP